MLLYLLRHGIAEDSASSGADADRALTAEGKAKLSEVLELVAAHVRPSLILTSPYKRARQTAALAAKILKTDADPEDSDLLTPQSTPEKIWGLVRERRAEASILLTGHQPLLGQLLAYLLASPALRFDFKKAGLAALDLESFRGDPHATLEWVITPKLARQ